MAVDARVDPRDASGSLGDAEAAQLETGTMHARPKTDPARRQRLNRLMLLERDIALPRPDR